MTFALVFATGLATGLAARADTIVAQRIAAQIRLLPLRKVTVGPDDQYHGMPDAAGSVLVFTHKADLVSHLRIQDLRQGEVRDLLPLSADSQEPALGPAEAGNQLAFTYYRFNARGDICHAKLPGKFADVIEDSRITCFPIPPAEADAERRSPFWRNAEEIGFVTRDIRTQMSRIVSENIRTGAREVLAEGRIWSPAMRPGGRYLFFNELIAGPQNTERVLVMKDLVTGHAKLIRFALPGISGFPAVSEDEKYLYFSHYLNDTNHDNVIDGSDNSVIFRVPVDTLRRAEDNERIFPEQLSSVESNCSFPRPFADSLFVTCAFEGSLDVYQMPATGIVPIAWGEALLRNAHQTSRTYQDRILLLNTLKYRLSPKPGQDIELRLLSDHLLADDTSAARYYVKELQAAAKTPAERDYYELLRLYLKAREQKKAQPSEEISRAFREEILGFDGQMQKISSQARLRSILRGMLRTFLNDPRESERFLAEARSSGSSDGHALVRYFYFELAAWTLPRIKSDGDVNSALVAAYRQMMTAPEFSEESRIYYAFNFLRYLQEADVSLPERITRLTSASPGLPNEVAALLKSEAAALKVILAPDDAAKQAAYRDLDLMMSATRGDYFLRKALYIRAILNFTEAADFKYLDLIATNWLRYTSNDDTEFAYAREVFATGALDRAYADLHAKNYQLAGNFFYESLSLTDDLESHAGYLRAMVLRNQRATIDERYQNLRQRQFIDDNLKFVEALLNLIDSGVVSPRGDFPATPKTARDTKALDHALEKLLAMQQDRDSPVRYLLLGYCYLEKLLRQGAGYDFDQELFQNAHRDLMLAYDLGRDNPRIKASALMDLGLLHQRAQNHRLAVKFFSLRKALGFLSNEEAARLAWFHARSLYYDYQAGKAADEITEALKASDLPKAYRAPMRERQAFYLESGGRNSEAAAIYADLVRGGTISGDLSRAKVYLSYGYNLYKQGRTNDARSALMTSLESASRLGRIAKGKDRRIDFEPIRVELADYGLLGRMGTDAERVAALEHRRDLLPQAKPLLDQWLSTAIQNRLQLAELYTRIEPARSVPELRSALGFAEELGSSSQYLGNAVYRAAVDYLAHALLHPRLHGGEDSAGIQKFVENCLKAYGSQKNPSSMLDYQRIKLGMLWDAYAARFARPAPSMRAEIQALLASEAARGLKDSMPAQWKELQALQVALTR